MKQWRAEQWTAADEAESVRDEAKVETIIGVADDRLDKYVCLRVRAYACRYSKIST